MVNTKNVPKEHKFMYKLACKLLVEISNKLKGFRPRNEREMELFTKLNTEYTDHFRFVKEINASIENPPFELANLN